MKSARIRIIETGVKLAPADEEKMIAAMRSFAHDAVDLCAEQATASESGYYSDDVYLTSCGVDKESIVNVKKQLI